MDEMEEEEEEEEDGDDDITGGVAMQGSNTYTQVVTASLEEFTRPTWESDAYELYEDSKPQTKKGRTVI